MSGIVGYGTYIPKYRIKVEEIARMWGKNSQEIISALKMYEKSVPGIDEDSVTLGVQSGRKALKMAGLPAKELEAMYVGSESHSYSVNPSSTTIAQYLGMGNDYFAVDLQFACKAATAGMQIVDALIDSNKIKYGIAIGSDTAQGKPRDALEYASASASAAFILGNKKTEIIAEILDTSSYSSDTPDFWRREGQKYPSHFGRFSGEPAYFAHIVSEAKKLLAKNKVFPKDFAYCVFHMPNGKFPRIVAQKLGFTPEQLAPSLIVEKIGNSYAASSLMGLSAVLDIAKPHQKIFFVSYGSGAGSDGFVFQTTPILTKKQKITISVMDQLKEPIYLSYSEYLKHTHAV